MSADKVTKSTIQLGTIMKIKSLLLASAAAMVTVSGAQAADAVIVEPEPAEYVRVCDAYGAGFFFIPGTETCMRFSGYVRTYFADAESESTTNNITAGTSADPVETTESVWNTRARFNIDTRNETELGTLRGVIRFQADSASDDGATTLTPDPSGGGSGTLNNTSTLEIDKAYITLAGFRAGIADSLFNANFATVNLEGVAGEDFNYGFSNSHILDYTYAVGDFHLSVGIEDRNGDNARDISYLARLQYSADSWTLGVVGEREDDKDVAYKIYGDVDLSEFVPGGSIGGWYMAQDREDETLAGAGSTRLGANGATTGLQTAGADNIWGIGYQMDLTDNVEFVALHTQASDATGSDSFTLSSGSATALPFSGDAQATTIGLNWYPVAGLKVFGSYTFGTTELQYTDPATTPDEDYEVDTDENFFIIGLRRSF